MGRHIRDNTDAAAQEADDRITEEGTQPTLRYEIFGTSTCPYCDKAKELLTAIGAQFVFFNIDEDEQAFDQLVGRIKSWKTVPQIFHGANHIGGFQELKDSLSGYGSNSMKFHKTGEFKNYAPIAEALPQNFVFIHSNRVVMTISFEGELSFGEGLSQSEAAQQAAKVLLDYWLQARGFKRNEELLKANNRYLLRARASEEYLAEAIARLEPVSSADHKFLQDAEQYLKEPWR